ncbi:hypothetical protein [Desulfosediminicola ganghwensis]|uniref:hypothetical protein n=1 Tax=Desulfosediminicola ganghwensis TaxID=2569540 RepID=UPI0010ACF565|nr:hypothetical protein [Desulfosediminicola ganghwensis]
MQPNKKNSGSGSPKQTFLIETTCILSVAILYFVIDKFFLSNIEDIDLRKWVGASVFFATLGLLHILGSNVLSYLYGLQAKIGPAIIAEPKSLKLIGWIVFVFSLLLLLLLLSYE